MTGYQGTAIAKGIAYDNVLRIVPEDVQVIMGNEYDPVSEVAHFEEVRQKTVKDVKITYEYTLDSLGPDEAKIFEAHLSMLEDEELTGQIEAFIQSNKCHASYAIEQVGQQFVTIFESMDNAYMRERAADIKDITMRMIKHAVGFISQRETIKAPCIIVAHDLTPSMTASFDTSLVKGIITEVGGPTSHSAIIAKLLGIPYIVLPDSLELFEDGDVILFDGADGLITKEPNTDLVSDYEERRRKYDEERQAYASLDGLPAQTKDGIAMELIANIGSSDDMEFVANYSVESVGLFRTEFLFMKEKGLPSEEEQFNIYKTILRQLTEGYLTIRTLDIGGDKNSPHLDIPEEDNPFLGYRGIRLCLGEKEIFKTQLRAILRASAYGKIKIMFPMISSMSELDESKALLEACKEELKQLSTDFDQEVQVGMMMETPAAVVMADLFAKEVDFFSIGTNDLVQYTMAVDRMNNKIAGLYSAYDPSVIRSIGVIAKAASDENIDVSICGEAAADIKLLPIWVGLGIRKLSMTASSVPEVKWYLSQFESDLAVEKSEAVCKMRTKEDVVQFLG